MSTYAVRHAMERHGVSLLDRRHIEDGAGAPTCGADAEGAFVVDDPEDADCPACRLIVLGPGGLC